MTPYLKLIKGSHTLLSFFYIIATSILKTIQNFPTSHKIILISLYYIIFISFTIRLYYGSSPLKLYQNYLKENSYEIENASMISLFFTIFIAITLFSSFTLMGFSIKE